MEPPRSTAPLPAVNAGAVEAIDSIPRHVAIIMDGNGRWAGERGWSRSQGHRAGEENIRRVVRCLAGHGVKYVTLFAFSTENWYRPDDEVKALMELLGEAVGSETDSLHREGVCIKHIGRLDRLPPNLQDAIRESLELTKDNDTITLSVALDYGGRAEIIDAVRAIVAGKLAPDEITEDTFRDHLYTGGLPDPDLVIRTGGEMRLSNFLLWQTAYSEYYSSPVLWPDFDEGEMAKALEAYGRRQRRYGRVALEEEHS